MFGLFILPSDLNITSLEKPEQEMEKVMTEGSNAQILSLADDSGPLLVKRGGLSMRVEFNAGGTADVYTNVPVTIHAPANDDAEPKATHEIGTIESTGEHKGEIYGGIYPADNKPIWFLGAPRLMTHYKAAAWAATQGGSLPTRKQGDYLTTLKDKGGAFTDIFNRGGSFPAGYVWLAEPSTNFRVSVWCQRLSNGDQGINHRNNELPVLSVRR
jgi:hypothetical protein